MPMSTDRMPANIRYDLKRPCSDCPFTPRAALHQGVGHDLGDALAVQIMSGSAAHTCHKTDPRADSPEGQRYQGEVQHCAGFLLMMERASDRQNSAQRACQDGRFDPKKLDRSVRTFTLLELCKVYVQWQKDGLPEGRTGLDYLRPQELAKAARRAR